MKYKIIVVSLMILAIMLLSGCSGGRELNELAIIISIGIDKSENDYLFTFQVLHPIAIASNKTVNESPITIYTETGKDLFEAKRRTTKQSPRELYNSHLRTVVFSEEVAKEGIAEILDFFVRDHELRSDFYFFIAKGTTANHILRGLTPLEVVPGIELIRSLRTSEKLWAPTKTVQLLELVNGIITDGKNPVLTGVEVHEHTKHSNSIEALKQTNAPKLVISNLAAFRGDKLAGWLTEDESKGYNYMMGNVKDTAEDIQYDDQNEVVFEVVKTKAKSKVYLLNDKPAINVEIVLKTNVATQKGDLDITNQGIKDEVEWKMEQKVKNSCYTALESAQKDLGTDIFGFGDKIHKKYPKLWKKLKNNWNNEFVSLQVNIEVHVQIGNLGEVEKPIF